MVNEAVEITLSFFNSTFHKIKKSSQYKNIINEPIFDKIAKFTQPQYVTTLEHARLCIIMYAKECGLVPKSLVLHSRCRCMLQPQFMHQIRAGIECHDRVNKYNPFSFHFVNFDLATKELKRLYVETIENMNRKHRLDYTSRKLLLKMCRMICQDEILIERVSLKFAWRFHDNKYLRFLVNLTYFFAVRSKCKICHGELYHKKLEMLS